MTDKKEILKRLNLLAEYFKEELSDNTQQLYMMALDRYEDEQIFMAFEKLMFEKYFPRLHVFKELIEGSKEDNALEIWQYVLKQISSKGIRNCKFDTATTNAINSVGGIEAIGLLDRDKLTFKQKDFCRAYEVTEKREERKEIGSQRLKELTDNLVKKIGV